MDTIIQFNIPYKRCSYGLWVGWCITIGSLFYFTLPINENLFGAMLITNLVVWGSL
jgi:hypothetical protein